ncbi:hypothetical protein AB5I41_02105 [Sphingomonas sp. MMS24-JH45]
MLPRGVTGAALADMIDGWELLLAAEVLDAESLAAYADARGGGLFAVMAQVSGGQNARATAAAGRCWALADLAAHIEPIPRSPGVSPRRRWARTCAPPLASPSRSRRMLGSPPPARVHPGRHVGRRACSAQHSLGL